MAATAAHRFARAVQERQDVLRERAKDAGMPSVIKPSIWERARKAYFDRPFTHKQRLENQMAANGDE